jgi:hypothetical protein
MIVLTPQHVWCQKLVQPDDLLLLSDVCKLLLEVLQAGKLHRHDSKQVNLGVSESPSWSLTNTCHDQSL